MSKYLIIPGCSDLNRGDQALVWETMKFAKRCGYIGEYYLITETNEPTEQTTREGIKILQPILEHPSRKFKNKDNTVYTLKLKIKWGCVAAFDFFVSLLFLSNLGRKIISFFLNKKKKESFNIFNEVEAVFIKGGGLFQTYGGIISTYSMYFWCFHIFFAHSLKKPIYMMPNSMGPFKGPFVKKIVKKALQCCNVISARESITEEMVRNQLGLNIKTFPDLAFSLDCSRIENNDVLKKHKLPSGRERVAITMRPYRFPEAYDSEKAYQKFKCEMRAFILWLYDNGYMPIIVEQVIAKNTHENDISCISEVIEMIDKEKYCLISDSSLNCRDLKSIYGMCDYIVGTRFHSVIFSFGNNVPGIAICYAGNKAQGIMKDIGLSDYAISIYDVTAEHLEQMFLSLIKNKETVITKIKKYNNDIDFYIQRLVNICSEGV